MKLTRLQMLKNANWIIPLAYALAAIVVGMILPRAEGRFWPDLTSTISVSAATNICSSVASGMLALTGIVFSLTFVMVQFSSTAYSPRLVLWVARDPVMSHALGMFTATFLYALMVLAWVDRGGSGTVGLISALLVLLTLLASMGMFVALIDRIGRLQINRMLIFTGDQGRKAIGDLYPALEATSTAADPSVLEGRPVTQTLVHSGRPRVIQAVRMSALTGLATEADAVVEMACAIGDTVVELTPILRVRGPGPNLDEQALADAVELGDERTFEQDPKYAIRLVADIAIKALSPAINDPTTAVQAMDQIEDLLLRLGQRRLELGAFHDRDGALRLVVPFPTWEDLLLISLDEILSYGADSVQVMRRMNALLINLIAVLPQERHAALRRWEKRLKSSIARSFSTAQEKEDASVGDRQGLGLHSEDREDA